MVGKLFGTDGIRGIANSGAMTVEMAMKVSMAVGLHFRNGTHRNRVVIGKDTRLSGYMIESALVAGFTSIGMDVFLLGPLPTPAVAILTPSLRADLGVMISASHNPYSDNGIKLFGPDGYKLSRETEERIESLMDTDLAPGRARPADIGQARRVEDERGRYVEYVKRTFPRHLRLDGLRIVVDCANGSAYKVAPATLWELGAEVIAINDKPDGFNINDGCGSESPAQLCRKVCETQADIGVALDGDADRLLVIDEKGHVVDSNHLLGVIADFWSESGRLASRGVVTTVMSNLGLERFLKGKGLDTLRTAVGDRHILNYMRDHGYNVGGEPSGHIILSDLSMTGDGLVTFLQLLRILVETGRKASSLCRPFDLLPQILQNVPCRSCSLNDAGVLDVIESAKRCLGEGGRLIVRPSGTEPLIRIMAEGEDAVLIGNIVTEVREAIEACNTRNGRDARNDDCELRPPGVFASS